MSAVAAHAPKLIARLSHPACRRAQNPGFAAPQVATAVADQAFKQGLARIKRPADLKHYIEHRMWGPRACPACCSTVTPIPSEIVQHSPDGPGWGAALGPSSRSGMYCLEVVANPTTALPGTSC